MKITGLILLSFLFNILTSCLPTDSNSGKRLVIKSKKIYSSSRGFLKEEFIFIEKGKISALSSIYKKKAGDRYMDYSDFVVLPGFIDAHTHIFLSDHSFDADFPGELVKNLKMPESKRVHLAKERARAYLKAGFVAIRDLGNSGRYLDRKLHLSTRDKPEEYPRIYYSGPGLCVGLCQFSLTASKAEVNREYDTVSNFIEAKKKINQHIQHEVNFLKLYIDNIPSEGLMEKELFKKIFEYAQLNKMKVVVHAIDKSAIEFVSSFPVHSLEHVNELTKKSLENIKKHNISIVPTDLGFKWIMQGFKKRGMSEQRIESETLHMFKERSLRYKNLFTEHIEFGFGSDFYFPVDIGSKKFVNAIFDAFDVMDLSGANEKIKIKALTLGAAKAAGAKDLGDIAIGMDGSLVVLKEDPLQNFKHIRKVHAVFHRGEKVE